MSRLSDQELKIQMLADAAEAQRPRLRAAGQPLLDRLRRSLIPLGIVLSAMEVSRGTAIIADAFRRGHSRGERRERLFRAALETPRMVRCLQRNIPCRRR